MINKLAIYVGELLAFDELDEYDRREFVMNLCRNRHFLPRYDICPICGKSELLHRHHWYDKNMTIVYVVLICRSCNSKLQNDMAGISFEQQKVEVLKMSVRNDTKTTISVFRKTRDCIEDIRRAAGKLIANDVISDVLFWLSGNDRARNALYNDRELYRKLFADWLVDYCHLGRNEIICD